MVKMNPKEIKTHPQFENLFPINAKVLQDIEMDMRTGTYDVSQMIVLGTWAEQSEPVCIDGHTRLRAAINIGIDSVPIITHEFDSEDDALEKAIKLQRHRRNMNDADIMVCIAALDSRRMRGGDRRSEEAKSKASSDAIENASSKSAAQTAELLGTSTSKVERCRSIIQHGKPETVEEVKQGQKSINKAATELREERKAEKDNTEIKESNETNLQPKKKAVKEFSVTLSKGHYEKLRELGGSVEEHVGRAIDRYIYMLIESGEIEINPDEYDD